MIDVSAKLSTLGDERKALDKDLKTATQELFGQPREDAEAVAQLLRKGFREELAPLPKATAFDLLDQISRKVPPADSVKLDVGELDIRPKKTFIKGTVDSAAAVDEMAAKLKEIDCFEEVTKGAITEVSGGAKQFTLNIELEVPMSALRPTSEVQHEETLARPLAGASGRHMLRSEWERLAPRERRLVTWLAIAVVVLAVTLGAMADVHRHQRPARRGTRDDPRGAGRDRQAPRRIPGRQGAQRRPGGAHRHRAAAARRGDLEAAARGENVQIAESSERPAAPAGRRYVQHDVDVKLREVDLQSLTKFLRRVETGPRLIVFTRMSLKHRYSETDKLDVELTATAFERVKEDKRRRRPTDRSPGAAAGKKE